jgi:hypothetical protein
MAFLVVIAILEPFVTSKETLMWKGASLWYNKNLSRL